MPNAFNFSVSPFDALTPAQQKLVQDSVDIVATYGPNDVWDGRALVAGRSSLRFVASEELLAYQVPRETVIALIVRPEKGVSAQSILIHPLRTKDVAQGLPTQEALKQLLHFMGSRPLVGYYLEFDVAMLNKVLFPMLGWGLPQPQIEVSAMYHSLKMRQLTDQQRLAPLEIDLHLAPLMQDLGLPMRDAHNPVNDAVMATMAFIKLRHLLQA
ncbi:MAG: 3'-5' exonuclease [Limnohabitans sp.]